MFLITVTLFQMAVKTPIFIFYKVLFTHDASSREVVLKVNLIFMSSEWGYYSPLYDLITKMREMLKLGKTKNLENHHLTSMEAWMGFSDVVHLQAIGDSRLS